MKNKKEKRPKIKIRNKDSFILDDVLSLVKERRKINKQKKI